MISESSHSLLAFTDGAAKGNPGPGGWGAIVAGNLLPDEGDAVFELGGHIEHTTNNRMELTAAVEVIKFVSQRDVTTCPSLTIFTDSAYVVNGITKWVVGWQRNNWQTADHSPVKNSDLWQQLVELVRKYPGGDTITWQLLPGHSGVPGNERTDQIASDFALGVPVKLFTGRQADYLIDLTTVVPIHTKKSSSGSSSGKAYSYLSLVDGVLVRHTDWVSCQARVKGKAAQFRKTLSPAHEQEIITEWGVADQLPK